ncbi:MAG: acyltransferase domain-containing protein [Vicinamibacterales bacterium]
MAGRRPWLVTLAAPDRPALVEAVRALRDLAPEDRDPARRPGAGRGPERLAILAAPDQLAASLDFALARLPALARPRLVSRAHGLTYASGSEPGRVAFVFPGQGSEYVGMLAGLRRAAPEAAAWFDALDRAAAEAGQPPLTALLESGGDARGNRALYDMERGAQLGTVADLALYAVLTRLGVRADVHVGHSNGEHPAVVAAGRVALDRDALCRGFVHLGLAGARLPRPARAERLLTVGMLTPDRLRAAIDDAGGAVTLAMDNCPTQAVVGGLASDVDPFAARLAALGAIVAPLPFDRAYHTPLFADWAHAFETYYASLPLVPGRVPVYSCLDAAPLPAAPADCRAAMAAQWTALVRFRATIARLHADGARTFVEVGPGGTLTAFVEDTLRGRPHTAVATNSPARDDVEQVLHALGQLFVAGLDVTAAGFEAPGTEALPPSVAPPAPRPDAAGLAYAADVHRRLIHDARGQLARAAARVVAAAAAAPAPPPGLLARPDAGFSWRRRFSRAADPFVDHHALGRACATVPGGYPLPVLAFTVSLEIAAEAARAALGRAPVEMTDIRASRWLALVAGRLALDVAATPGAPARIVLRVADPRVPMPAFEAAASASAAPPRPLAALRDARPPSAWTPRRFYEEFAFHGPAFQGVTAVTAVSAAGLDAELTVTALPGVPVDGLVFDPALVDCAGQLVAFWLLEQEGVDTAFGVFPFQAARLAISRPPLAPGARLKARARVSVADGRTRADVRIDTAKGEPVIGLEGFEQRIVRFPPAVARRLFGGDGAAVPAPGDVEFLEGSWGIWARALAHVALSPDELSGWHGGIAPKNRARWLVERLGGGDARRSVPE